MTLLGSTIFSSTGFISFSANEFDRKKDKMITSKQFMQSLGFVIFILDLSFIF
jgi:hypothetical protein